jgi:hypothetical protein
MIVESMPVVRAPVLLEIDIWIDVVLEELRVEVTGASIGHR